jgi:antitoxin component YwqK of YwqJK toxin-antitoxin module
MSDIEVIDLTDGHCDYDYSKWGKKVPKDSIRFFEHESNVFYYFFKRKLDWKIVGDFFCYKENGDLVAKSFYKDGKLHGEVISFSDGLVASIYIWVDGVCDKECYEGIDVCKKYFAKKRLKNL